jgi:hypothetical protein
MAEFSDLKGEIIERIDRVYGDEDGSGDALLFYLRNGDIYKMSHETDCCESVFIEDICGDLSDILRSKVLVAEEVTKRREDMGDSAPSEMLDDSETWTFYKIDTSSGGVTIRWYGASNGYYSESVDFRKVESRRVLL